MQQRQLRLGDILDDYCPRERRLTNHAVVAMVGELVKQTRCTTCDAEHEYKQAKVPRQRKKTDSPAALYAQVAAGRPKRVTHDPDAPEGVEPDGQPDAAATMEEEIAEPPAAVPVPAPAAAATEDVEQIDEPDSETAPDDVEDGPVHRPLIRATLPRPEGQPPPSRPAPDFTIRQPGRNNRFRPRHQHGGQQFFGNRSNGGSGGPGSMRGGAPRPGGGRPPHGSMMPRASRRQGPGRKRSK
jgi:hypothetical protein